MTSARVEPAAAQPAVDLGLALDLAKAAALAAGKILKAGLGRAKRVQHKGLRDLVTDLDLASQAEITGRIKAAFPEHLILAEEDQSPRSLAATLDRPLWLIDPLDGTTNFVHGLPAYAVSIGLGLGGRLVLGVIYDPEREELFSGLIGSGAWLNDAPLQVSAVADLAEALTCTGFPYDLEPELDLILKRLGRMLRLSQGVRRLGSAALDLAYVACGRLDAFWEWGLKPWDLAAGAVIVEAAGGLVTNLEGGPLNPFDGRILAANERLLPALLAALEA